jgi:hypothetical protein
LPGRKARAAGPADRFGSQFTRGIALSAGSDLMDGADSAVYMHLAGFF